MFTIDLITSTLKSFSLQTQICILTSVLIVILLVWVKVEEILTQK